MDESGDQERRIETPDVPGVPPPPPQQGASTRRWVLLAIGGCAVLFLLLLVGLGGCFAILAYYSVGDQTGVGKSTVAIGEPLTVGDVTWEVTDARQANRLTADFMDPVKGHFVIVDFDFTNDGSEPVTLDNYSLALIDSEGRESQVDTDSFLYVPGDRQIFLERINPGVTRQGEVIFEVASGASGFELEAGDTDPFSDENGYVDLGF